jgi:hypothetical protein
MTLSRRFLIQASAIGLAMASEASATTNAGGVELLCLPVHVYKTADFSHERTESWVLNLFVQTHDNVVLQPKRLQIDLFNGATHAKSATYVDDGFRALTIPTASLVPHLPDGATPSTPLYWPFAIRIRHCEPVAAAINSMRVTVTVLDPRERQRTAQITIPIESYQQKTALIYPFRGKGIILQAGVTNGGHRNRSGQFAIDGFGLTETYAVMPVAAPETTPSVYAGWGRSLIAPADGVIVHARNDRPDQPDPNTSDPRYYAPEFPNGGDVGNHVIIDHGNNEFSMIAHFQAGSVLVRAGDRVRQGDPLGKLGASGDATGPHVHYQLQAGPDWQYADALPCTFTNVHDGPLVRGTYFNAL